MIRKFIGFDAAAAILESDYIGLRQAFELGLGSELPAYVNAREQPFLAYPSGPGVTVEASDIHEAASGQVTVPGFGTLTSFDLWDAGKLGDGLGEVTSSDLPQSVTGRPVTLDLRGYFRVSPSQLKEAARQDPHGGMTDVAPDSRWAEASPVSKMRNGAPSVRLVITSTDYPGYREPPALRELQFKIADVESLKASRSALALPTEVPKPRKIRADREENLLRVIAGLWALSDLPHAHNVTADKLSALFDGWGWDKPAAGTMADTILREALNLPGAVIRK